MMNMERQPPEMAIQVEAHNQHCSHAKSFAIHNKRCVQHAPSRETYLQDEMFVSGVQDGAKYCALIPADG
jgi:hypothetical protein